MAKDNGPTDDEIRQLIKESRSIFEEDRERATYRSLHEKYGKETEDPSTKDGAPPKKEEEGGKEGKPKSRSLWWGELEDSE